MNLKIGYKFKPIIVVADDLKDFRKAVKAIEVVEKGKGNIKVRVLKPTSAYWKVRNQQL